MTSETREGVGWISQVREETGDWISWTQWHDREVALRHCRSLLANKRHAFVEARIVRVDWTVVEVVPDG